MLLFNDRTVGRSYHPNLRDGAALQICLQSFQVDYYPYHLAKSSRKHWPLYKEGTIPHIHWQEQAFNSFKTKFLDLLDRNKSHHTPLYRANKVHRETVYILNLCSKSNRIDFMRISCSNNKNYLRKHEWLGNKLTWRMYRSESTPIFPRLKEVRIRRRRKLRGRIRSKASCCRSSGR